MKEPATNDRLHRELPSEFKILLQGNDYPSTFHEGDKLTILNYTPHDPTEYLLVKTRGSYKIVTYEDYEKKKYRNAHIIGVIKSIERGCHKAFMDLLLGSYYDEEFYPPDKCCDCKRLYLLEIGGKETACCMTSRGLISLRLEDKEEESESNSWNVETIVTNMPGDCVVKQERGS